MTPAQYDLQVNLVIFDFMVILSLSINFQVSHSEISLSARFNEVLTNKMKIIQCENISTPRHQNPPELHSAQLTINYMSSHQTLRDNGACIH